MLKYIILVKYPQPNFFCQNLPSPNKMIIFKDIFLPLSYQCLTDEKFQARNAEGSGPLADSVYVLTNFCQLFLSEIRLICLTFPKRSGFWVGSSRALTRTSSSETRTTAESITPTRLEELNRVIKQMD